MDLSLINIHDNGHLMTMDIFVYGSSNGYVVNIPKYYERLNVAYMFVCIQVRRIYINMMDA